MFKRPNRQPRYPQTPANRFVNRILTYGLIFFIVYSVYTNSRQSHPKEAVEADYTPINWCKYFKATNLLSGETTSYNFTENDRVLLQLTPQDLKKIGNGKTLPVYELEFSKNPNCDILLPLSN